MKHITLERTKVTWAEFDIDDKYTLQQIQKFIDLEDDEDSLRKTHREILADLRKHGVKIHNYDSYAEPYPVNKIHIFNEERTSNEIL